MLQASTLCRKSGERLVDYVKRAMKLNAKPISVEMRHVLAQRLYEHMADAGTDAHLRERVQDRLAASGKSQHGVLDKSVTFEDIKCMIIEVARGSHDMSELLDDDDSPNDLLGRTGEKRTGTVADRPAEHGTRLRLFQDDGKERNGNQFGGNF
ncbi:hypothetical protein ACRALDRAFT_1065355, partial [Sodiomyces alcalophilus JCM 7366]|uniref:uncharacterized protein n=1 Tax=Sodiomyces alcalophilus JCM 7366 TaxID=591952 RepID=UPI0039B47825